MPESWTIDTLANGLRVVTTPLLTSQSVSLNIFIGAGSRSEEERYNGLFHYLEHMLFKGTSSRPDAIQIAEAIEGVGGVLNAYTGKELTCYWNRVPYDQLNLAADVLGDMLCNSLLDAGEVDRERTVVQQEIRRGYDQPGQWVGEMLSHAAFGDQPIGRSIAGTVESVAAFTRDDLESHIDQWYVPGRMVFSVGGNVEHGQVMELAEGLFGALPARPLLEFEAARPGMHQRVAVEWRDISQCNLALAWPGFPRDDDDRYALTVLNTLLGRGMSSRLFREVRERRGLAYSVGSGAAGYADIGMFSVSAGVSPENATEATTVILAECRKLIDETVSPEEMRKARDYATGNFRLGLETSMALAQRAGENLLQEGKIRTVDEVVERVSAVTAEDVRRVARRIFGEGDVAVAAVGKIDEADLERAVAAA